MVIDANNFLSQWAISNNWLSNYRFPFVCKFFIIDDYRESNFLPPYILAVEIHIYIYIYTIEVITLFHCSYLQSMVILASIVRRSDYRTLVVRSSPNNKCSSILFEIGLILSGSSDSTKFNLI